MENLKPAVKMSGGVRVVRRTRKEDTPERPISSLFESKANSINQKIARMPEVSFIKLRDMITHGIKVFSERLVRDVWCDRETYRIFREDKIAWLMRTIFKPSDEVRIMVKDDLSSHIMRTFKQRGIQLVLSFIDSIDSSLVEKQGEPAKAPVLNESRFQQALKYFGLEGTRISFATIRKAYDEYPNKSEANEMFMYLRDNYSSYLQSIGISSPI